MPVLANARHERFAQELVKGTSQGKAYALAGFKPSDQHASRLASSGKVRARVAELQEAVQARVVDQQANGELQATGSVVISVESLLRELEEARQMALALKQPGAIIKAVQAKAVLAGLVVNYRPAERIDPRTANPDELSDAELLAFIQAYHDDNQAGRK
jgi:hypothetical protein